MVASKIPDWLILSLGILGILTSFYYLLGIPLSLICIILAKINRKEIKTKINKTSFILGLIGLILSIIFLILMLTGNWVAENILIGG